jgi:predicted phosphodiesterase
MARSFLTIAGNHERQLLAQWARPPGERDVGDSDGYAALQVTSAQVQWLRSLPATRWLGDDVFLLHGRPDNDLQYLMETVTPDYGLQGSLGLRAASCEEIAWRLQGGEDCRHASLVLCGHSHVPRTAMVGGTLVLNPGSVGLQAYDDEHPAPHRVQTGTPHARYALVERRGAQWNARLCSVAYDWQAMQRLAASRGRADWAYALATGILPPAAGTIAA